MANRTLIAFIWQFVKPHRWLFLFILSVSFVWSLDTTLWPYLLKLVIDIFTKYDNDRMAAWSDLKLPVFIGLGFWILVEVGFRIQGFLLAYLIPKVEAEMRMAMFDHVQRHSPKYFNEHFAGSLANKITDMIAQVTMMQQNILTMFLPAAAAFILGIIFFAFIQPLFSIILAVWISMYFIICFAFAQKCEHYENIHGQVRSELLGKIVDSLTNNFAVNLFYRFSFEYKFIARFQKIEEEKSKKAKTYVEYMRLLLGIFTFIGGALGIFGFMIYFWMHGSITTGQVAQLFTTAWNIILILWITGTTIPAMYQSMGIAKQALTVMQDPQDIVDLPHAKALVVKKGAIIFENVSFHYGKRKLFQGKHVTIHGAEKVGLVGYSGAGKSTFVNLILRFYPIEKGKILVDGQDINQITLESLRSQIALIPQDPILFHRTLKENIRFGKLDASDAEIYHAAKLAHCDEFISKMPLGYDSPVGERGTKVSGGERQRIAIARAILANAPILILDEATSALDSVTEHYIQDSLETLMKGRTTIVIAHRLSTLSKMDRILVFEKGKIVEEGSHMALLSFQGHYARMWKRQAGGFLLDPI